ncbi:diacylglycerol kinase catalytic domain protein [Methyloversatilis sp. RAC08]|uniref:diacylglycerol/lipid kinase family protein n=1 Tax=Methyloversatilis sp. RAC08 TaxID=1842540 RepID=UPI00083DDB4E|nr:diacylglycerol kinase family protein [Methyloversatilis sp. RAC08]AOF83706.1 diacylglycerol kinase catalytic domain protein [Methyloversatilis sp. RAC08]
MPSSLASQKAPLFIVLNAASGISDSAQTRQTIASVLNRAGRAHHVFEAGAGQNLAAVAQRAVAQARAAGGIVVAAGGDGTINTVAQALLGSGLTFGVLPQGTFNYFSREHGIPADTEAALQLLLDGEVRPVQVGRVNDRVFLVNASLGLYPALLENREEWKRQLGRSRLVAFWAGLLTLLREHRRLTLDIEHGGARRTVRTVTLFVGNNRLQLEQLGVPEASDLARGRLAGITLRPTGKLAMLWLLVRGALGRLGDADRVVNFSFRTLNLTSRRRRHIKVATDGEVAWMNTPLHFEALPNALNLIVPRGPTA